MAPHDDDPDSQLATSGCLPIQDTQDLYSDIQDTKDWSIIDDEFRAIISPIHVSLAREEITAAEAAEIFADLLSSHLQHRKIIRQRTKTQKGPHRPRAMVKLTERLAKAKNKLRRDFRHNPREFLNAVRAHNKVFKATSRTESDRNTLRKEKAFNANPWSFSKSVCHQHTKTPPPQFSAETCFNYFKPTFEAPSNSNYSELPQWVKEVMPIPEEIESPFDMSPIKPKNVKSTLRKLSNASAPGPDKIMYAHLKKLPSAHHFLATLYSIILLKSHQAPASWGVGDLHLIYKSGPPTDPANYRPIALSSVVGKLFHRIVAYCLETYLLNNHLIDSKLQKGFLKGIPGVLEHILTLNTIIANAKRHGLPLSITFIDLRNAFGSIPHKLIFDMLAYTLVPSQLSTYIASLYGMLTASISTQKWETPSFRVTKGIFQGDTLSPILFLLCFSPITAYAEKISFTGFQMIHTLPHSSNLPPIGSYIYVKWMEEESDEPCGWYLAQTEGYAADGRASINYMNGSTEMIDLNQVEWA